MKLTGAQIVWECLRKEGVDTIFGFPGGAIMPTHDALLQYPEIRHYLVRHEQNAAHAADGYARSTGKVGVTISTSGPGATNLVTGLATAMMDSSPIVSFTGQVPTSLLGNDAFQETDVTGVTLPVTKHNYLVTDVKELAQTIAEAFYIARSGRPGPVLVDLCKDVQLSETTFEYPEDIRLPGLHLPPVPDSDALAAAAELIDNAERPLILAGHGVVLGNASQELLALIEKAEIPVVNTLLGLGGIPQQHPLCLGMGGMHGEFCTNQAIQECDVLIGVGMRFDDRVTGRLDEFAPDARVIHFELDNAEIGKNVPVDVPVLGDCKDTLAAILPYVEEQRRPQWMATIREWQAETAKREITELEFEELIPPYVMQQLYETTGGNCFVVSDVGQHQMWEAQYFPHQRPRQLITSGGLGTMGYGVPAAIGAKVGNPDALVWAVVGDGGFQMTMEELGTIMQERVPVKIAIVNNGFLGMVRQWQQLFFDKRYVGTPIMSPDYVKLASAYGIPAISVSERSDVSDAFAEANTADGPFLIEFKVKEEVNVYPMVAPGAAVDQMIRRPEPRVVQGRRGTQPSW